jgi:iron complex transport system ATP-binding protein
MNSPKLLILDEPCTGLDIFACESFLSLIETIGNSGDSPSLLYVSHHIEEILPLFGNTLLLKEGRIHSSGKTENILTGKNLTDFYGTNVEAMRVNERTSVHLKK